LNRRIALTGGLLGLLAMAAKVRAEDERGQLGFSISVDGDGPFWNPVLKSATVAKVTPASPAASAGLVPGDQIVEVEGRTVAGAKARELEPLMARRPGERLSLRVRRADGSVQQLVLVAAARR
jgi:C-terminal processing protease CtpA/Prc